MNCYNGYLERDVLGEIREREGVSNFILFYFYFCGKMKEQAVNGYHAGIRVDCERIRQ